MKRAWACESAAIECHKLASLIATPGRKQAALRKVAVFLHNEGLPASKKVVTVPEACVVGPCKRALGRLAGELQLAPSVRNWLLKRTHVCVGKLPKFRRELSQAQFARSTQLDQVFELTEQEVGERLGGKGMQKVDRNIDVCQRQDIDQKQFAVEAAMLQWSDWCRASKYLVPKHLPRMKADVQTDPCVRAAFQLEASTRQEYEDYCRPLQEKSTHVRVLDDKDKKKWWRIEPQTYQVLLLAYAVCCGTWHLCNMPQDEANSLVSLMLVACVPVRLHRFLGLHLPATWVPYAYVTVKSKCYGNGFRRCLKDMHSCCRKFVRYCKWPMRHRWRLVGRGLDVVLRCWGGGFEVASLKVAAVGLREDIDNLWGPPAAFRCVRCHSLKSRLSGVTADAGQFFETVEPLSAVRAANAILKATRLQHGHDTVTVVKSRRVCGFLGGQPDTRSRRFVVFRFSELLGCFAGCMNILLCTMRGLTFKLDGLPIGGLMSRIAASCVLAWQEACWVASELRRAACGFHVEGLQWAQLAVCRRYVDNF